MKKAEIKYPLEGDGITCPCCLKCKTSKNLISRFIDQLKSLKYNPISYHDDLSIYFIYAKEYKSKRDYLKIKWACNECLRRKKAFISTTINEQRKTDTAPIFAFYDLKSNCAKCRSKFLFKKEEWKYWIDELGFYFQTTKKYCENCQPIELLKKKLSNKIIQQRELNFGNEFVKLAIEISEIYEKLGMKQKSKGYLKEIINTFKEDYDDGLKRRMMTAYNNR